MLCALTVRTLKPGTFDQFREAFMQARGSRQPADRLRALQHDPEQRRTLTRSSASGSSTAPSTSCARSPPSTGYAEQLEAIAPFVESVGADGLYEIVEEFTARPA